MNGMGADAMANKRYETLIFLKEHASSTQPLQIEIPGHGTTERICTWEEPARRQQIAALRQSRGWYFPDDYEAFLLEHNGAVLFKHPYSGGGTELLSLERMERISHDHAYQIPPHWCPIAWTDVVIGSICIDSEKARRGEQPYLFFLDAMNSVEEAVPIDGTFSDWLERLARNDGREYWLK